MKKNTASKKKDSANKKGLTWREQRELETIEEQIKELEAAKEELEKKISTLDYQELAAASQELEKTSTKIDDISERWLELLEKEEEGNA